jgi:hypothetical protein
MPPGKPAYVYTGSEWIPIGSLIGAKYQSASPTAAGTGDLWIDSDNNVLSVWNGTTWTATSVVVDLSAYLTQSSASTTYATKISPSLTGIPTAPTASVGTDNTQIATTAFVYDQAPLFSNRNLLYNGSMQINQRSASVTGITTGDYRTADRWYHGISSLGTWTQNIENDAPTGSGFRKSLRMLCTTADASPSASDVNFIAQFLEGQDLQRIAKGTASAQPLTLSFWVKSNVTGTYIAELQDADNTRSVSASYTISASATWERKIITFPADTIGTFDNDNAASLYLNFWLGAGSDRSSGSLQTTWGSTVNINRVVGQTNLASAINNYWQITGVQLEANSNPTTFEFKNYSQELRECQRYYHKPISGTSKIIAIGSFFASNQVDVGIFFPVSMRTTPVAIITTGTDYYALNRSGGVDYVNSFTLDLATENSCRLYNSTEVSSTAGQACLAYTNNIAASIAFSAEL